MGLNVRPAYRVVANSVDITAKVQSRLKNLRLTDEVGTTADTLEICLADHIGTDRVQVPPTGAEIELFLGYDDSLRRMGLFVVDEIELRGMPSELTIRATAAPYEKSTGGMVGLQTQKSRSWKAGTTIGALVRRIAGEHRLRPVVADNLASIALPQTEQSSESDMNLLHRLARRYDAVAKPAGGRLVFMPRGRGTTASGQDMPRVTLTPQDGSDYRVTIATREGAGTCVAYYRDVAKAQRREVTVGQGEPVQRIRFAYRDRESAEQAARSALRRRKRAVRTLAYTMPGRPDILAESIATLSGFRDGVDGEWLVTRAEHYVGPAGYRVSIESELPNSDDDVSEADGAALDDAVQSGEEIDGE